jgi:predicted dehydrogenase
VTPVRIGLLGAARITPEAILTPAAERADVEVVAIAARDPARAARFAALHGVPRVEASYDLLIARDDLDLIYIASPPSCHAAHAIAALCAGKAVLCEKPFTPTIAQAEAMVAASRAADRPILEALHYRFHPAFTQVLDDVRSGVLGELVAIDATFETSIARNDGEFRWCEALGGGALLDLGCYAAHAIRTLCGGEPRVTSATHRLENGVDVETTAVMHLPSGGVGRLTCSMVASEARKTLAIRGDRGEITVSNYVVPHHGCTVTAIFPQGQRVREYGGVTTFAAQLAHVVAVLRDGAAPLTGGQDAIGNIRLLHAIRLTAGALGR